MSVRTFNRDDSPIALRNTATVVIAATKFMKAISPGRSRKPASSSPLVPGQIAPPQSRGLPFWESTDAGASDDGAWDLVKGCLFAV